MRGRGVEGSPPTPFGHVHRKMSQSIHARTGSQRSIHVHTIHVHTMFIPMSSQASWLSDQEVLRRPSTPPRARVHGRITDCAPYGRGRPV